MTDLDDDVLHGFIGRVLGDLGGAYGVPFVRIGAELGLYDALRAHGPATSPELAERTGTAERYVREWLAQQAASGYLAYDPDARRFTLPPEHAAVLADPDSPVYMKPAFDMIPVLLDNQAKVQPAFRTGEGVGWGDQAACLFCTVARFFRPGYKANLVASWLPALEGVVERLEAGARVADVGCGHGVSTLLMAEAFPRSRFTGFDFHPDSIEAARAHAGKHGAPDNLRFEVGTAKDYEGGPYDLVTFFDCLHDMGDPAGASAHVFGTLAEDGAWMIVEPMAGDRLEDNLNPVGRLYYAASTLICVPTSLAQEVGTALGAQAGEARLREVVTGAGFTRFRRAAETPFNLVLEARP